MKKIFLLFGFLLVGCANIQPKVVIAQESNVSYIILETGVDGLENQNSARVAFYITIPDSNNFAGVCFRTIVINTGMDTTSLSFLTGALLDSLAIGARLEVIRTVRFDAGLTKIQKRARIDNVFNNSLAAFLAKWYAQHDFYGLERVL